MSGQFCDDPDCQRCQHLGIGHEPPAAPELPEGPMPGWKFWAWRPRPEPTRLDLDFDGLRALLATQGLRIVDAKDRRVLEAMADTPLEWVQLWGRDSYGWLTKIALAELARREKP